MMYNTYLVIHSYTPLLLILQLHLNRVVFTDKREWVYVRRIRRD